MRSAQWFRSCVVFTLLVAVSLTCAIALAVGRVDWKTRTLEEKSGGSWKIELAIHLPRPPDIAMVPMRFSFEPTVYYERTLVDGKEGPQLRRVPLEHRQPLVESVDVGFMDPGMGKVQKRTKFSFKVTRAHGFEAGEYQVKITNSQNGQTVGAPVTLTFKGENEVVDRRSMVFTGNEGKKKKKEEASESKEPEKKQLTPDDEAFWEGGPTDQGDDGPPPIEEKPGGCGCRLDGAGGATTSGGLLCVAAGVLALAFGRRRSR